MTGKELWRLSREFRSQPTPTPIIAHDLILRPTATASFQPIPPFGPGASGDITLKEGQESNEFIAWSKKRGGPYMPTPIVYGDYFYACNNQGILTCYNAKNGERIYQQRIGEGGAYSASPVAADGKLYFSSEDGDVAVVKAGPK